jgi:hypothetical protein
MRRKITPASARPRAAAWVAAADPTSTFGRPYFRRSGGVGGTFFAKGCFGWAGVT